MGHVTGRTDAPQVHRRGFRLEALALPTAPRQTRILMHRPRARDTVPLPGGEVSRACVTLGGKTLP